MKQFFASRRDMIEQSNSISSQLFGVQQPFVVLTLVWMGIAVCSLMFISIFEFGLTWMAPWLLLGGIAATVAVLREGQRHSAKATAVRVEYSAASRCIWKLDSEC